jgi:hypothetical protein
VGDITWSSTTLSAALLAAEADHGLDEVAALAGGAAHAEQRRDANTVESPPTRPIRVSPNCLESP